MTKDKAFTTIALFLMLAMAVSLVALPFANAQTYEIYIRNSNTTVGLDGDPSVALRLEVRQDGSRIQHVWENVTLHVKAPGSSSWTIVGPMNTPSNGRLDYTYTVTALGIYQFMWNVPAQAELPTNPSTSDGSWYSEVTESEVVPRLERATYAYIGALPNPVGVNQEVLFHVGITQQLSIVGMGWEGLSITIERPDGKTDTIDDITTDSTGGTGRIYVPDITGNYTVTGHFPEQQTVDGKTTPGSSTGTWMLESSAVLTLVVLEDPVPVYPGHPLPTEYWTRPIDPQLREWHTSAGSWLVGTPDNKFVPYNEEAPDTAHILWTKPFITGGLVGGDIALESSINQGPVGFETGDAYQGKWGSRFIIAGKLIYTHHTSVRPLEYTCVDIRTGEELWKKTFLDNRSISMCQLFYWETYNYMGTYAYIWVTVSSTWYAFDPFDTTLRINMTNVPSGTTIVGERGEIYRYSISTSSRTMLVWNMSALISMTGDFRGAGLNTYNAGGSNPTTSAQRRAWALNITIPSDLSGSVLAVYLKDRVVGGSISNTDGVTLWGFSLEPGREGNLLFKNTWPAPAYWEEGQLTISGFGGGWVAWSNDPYVAVLWIKETQEHYGFSLETGKYLWGPTEPQYYLDSVEDSASDVRNIAYGNLYSASVGGICYCYNATTGQLQWKYEATDPYHDYLLANTWWLKPVFYTDGKVYLGHTEHSVNQPMPRGAPFICLNATTGEEIWRINGAFRQTRWGGRAIIGDSVMVTMDTYDQRVYAVGKGPSAITVIAGPKISVHGSNVVVEGMVTDVSPGTNDIRLTTRFPNGVPAVSDANMSEWMLHVYKQFELPADVVGVEVVVSVLDPNNNSYEVARTTSDASGYFGCTFEPMVPGFYKVIATFEGSGAYYGSFAETFVNVEEAPAATPEPTPEPASVADTYLVPGIIAIIVAIVVIGLVIILMLRKR